MSVVGGEAEVDFGGIDQR